MGPLSHNLKQLAGSLASQLSLSCCPLAVPGYLLSLELLIAPGSPGLWVRARAGNRAHVFRGLRGRTAPRGRLLLLPSCSLPSEDLGFKSYLCDLGQSGELSEPQRGYLLGGGRSPLRGPFLEASCLLPIFCIV